MNKKRHAIYYSTHYGRNDGPPLFYYFNLQKLFGKENVVHLMPAGDIKEFGKFDYHWCIDYGEDGLPEDHNWRIPEDGGKTIYVVSDAHITPEGKQFRYEKAKRFNYVFFNQKHFAQEYTGVDYISEAGLKNKDQYVAYLPHAGEPTVYKHFNTLKKYDICFIGHLQDVKNPNGFSRVDMLDRAFKEFPNFYFGTRNPIDPAKNIFEDAAKRFCESKIVLNISIGNDLNMRFFEALNTGSFLLTNKIDELKSAKTYGFEDGKHYVSYNSLDELVEKVKYYLSHDKEREQIAKTGYEQALKTGTYKSRIEKIMEKIS